MRTIRVTGSAQLRLRPDRTVVTMTLQGTEPEYAAALNRASREAEMLRDLLEGLSFPRGALKTRSFQIHAEYEGYEEAGVWKQRFAGYRFEHALAAAFDADSERLGAVLTALSNAPVSPMLQLSDAVRDPEAARRELLTLAVADARSKAELLAEASGVRLKELQSVEYTSDPPRFDAPARHSMDAPTAAKARIEMHYDPEDIVVSDAVTVLWEIE